VRTRTAQAGIFSRRMLAFAAVAAIALSLALTMRVALANDLNQFLDGKNPDGISWDNPDFQGTADDCSGANLDPGQVLWHFVHTGTGPGDLAATLDAEFDVAGAQSADGYVNGQSNVFYDIITGEDTLLSASDSINDDGLLLLSHICFGGEVASVSESASASASAEQSVEASAASVAASASGEQSVEAGTGTPAASTPNGALFGNGSSPLPTIAFSLILLASLGALAYANVKTVRNRN
jgi:hypothetical protein